MRNCSLLSEANQQQNAKEIISCTHCLSFLVFFFSCISTSKTRFFSSFFFRSNDLFFGLDHGRFFQVIGACFYPFQLRYYGEVHRFSAMDNIDVLVIDFFPSVCLPVSLSLSPFLSSCSTDIDRLRL